MGGFDLRDNFRQPESQWHVHAALLVSQILSGGYYVITKVALVNGMNRVVLSIYRDIIAVVFLIPAGYYFNRGRSAQLSWKVFGGLCLVGLMGIFGSQFLLFIGIELTSAEFSSAMQPSVPVIVAVITIVFGLEAIRWRRRDGQAKVAGIAICCAGAILMTFYKGPAILGQKIGAGSLLVSEKPDNILGPSVLGGIFTSWHLGTLCLLGNCLCMAVSINLQVPLLKIFPSPVLLMAYAYAIGTVLMGIAAIFLVNDSSAWVLSWDVNLIAVLYNGIISSALNFALMTWSLSKVGPLFVACYIPVQPVSSAVLALVFLGSTLYLGSVLGTVLILLGLLLVSWAREESARLTALSLEIESSHYSDQAEALVPGLKTPLLQV